MSHIPEEFHELIKKYTRKLCNACELGEITEKEANEIRELRDEIDRRLKALDKIYLLAPLITRCMSHLSGILRKNGMKKRKDLL